MENVKTVSKRPRVFPLEKLHYVISVFLYLSSQDRLEMVFEI